MGKAELSNKEKRKLQRDRLLLYLTVFERGSTTPFGQIGDITTDGLMLITKEPLETGENYNLIIEDSTGDNNTRQIPIVAQCRWNKPDATPDYICNGFQFINPTQQQKHSIRNIIEAIGFGDNTDIYHD